MEGAEGFCKQRLEVKNEQRNKNYPRTDNVCYRSGTHTQRNNRNVMCACMCSKGDIAVKKGRTTNQECRKMLAALNFDLQDKQRGTGWTHQDLR